MMSCIVSSLQPLRVILVCLTCVRNAALETFFPPTSQPLTASFPYDPEKLFLQTQWDLTLALHLRLGFFLLI